MTRRVILIALALFAAASIWKAGSCYRTARENAAVQASVEHAPFSPPSDGLVSEDRLLRFLEVCQTENAVRDKYTKPVADLHQANERDSANVNAIAGSMAYVADLRLQRARALQRVGMSAREQRWIILRIGESPWESETTTASKPGDAANAEMFARHSADLSRCVNLKSIRQDLDAYRPK